MTRLAWGAHGERFFETGTDRGVLYLSGSPGVPWNGLKAVNESISGGDARPYYLDGYKYLNIASYEEFTATIDAFSAPQEFGVCDGTVSIHNGLFATEQPRVEFGLSYRTLIGNDQDGVNHGYKIHLVYNALAAPSSRNNQSMGGGVNILGLSWSITTQPPLTTGIRPTAHFVIDSRRTPSGLLKTIEDILYGTNATEPRLPTVDELRTLFTSNGPLLARNLFTYPSFEAGSGEVTVYENLFTNPSFETANGTVEVWRNLALNPNSVPGFNGFSPNSGLWTVTKENAGSSSNPQGIATRTKSVLTAGTQSPMLLSLYNIDALGNVAPARKLGAWLYVTGSGYQARLGTTGAFTPLPAGKWVWVTGEAPLNGYSGAYISKVTGNASEADIAYITGVTAIEGTTVPVATIAPGTPYPSSSSPDSDLTASWVGTPNNSESVLTAPRPAIWALSSIAPSGVMYKSASGGVIIEHRGGSYSAATASMSGLTESEPSVSYLVEVEAVEGPVEITTFVTFGSTAKRVYASHSLAAGERKTIRVTAQNPDPQGTQPVTLSIGWHPPVPSIGVNAKVKIHRALAAKGTYKGPYFDGSTTPKIRRNLNADSRFQKPGGWSAVNSTVTYNNGVAELVSTGETSSNYLTPAYLLPKLDAGVPFSAAYRVENLSSRDKTFRIAVYNGSIYVAYGNEVVIPPGEIRTVSVENVITPAGSQYMQPRIHSVSQIGDRARISESVWEAATSYGSFFDGSTEVVAGGYATAWEGVVGASASYIYDPDFTLSWSGTPHASTSKLTGVRVVGVSPSGCVAIRSTRWRKSGPYSMRFIPTSTTTNVTYALLNMPASAMAGGTALVTFRQEEALQGSLWAQRGRPYTLNPMTQPSQAPNAAGETDMRWTWGPQVSSNFVLPHGGMSGSGDVWWDCLGIFEGDYKGPWFDGNSVEEGHTFVWLGEPDQSVSEHYSWYF